jgi:formylglycine-generating enzyme required for sulfatase activity
MFRWGAVLSIMGLLFMLALPTMESGLRSAQPILGSVQRYLAAGRVNPRDGLKYVHIPPGQFQMGCSPGDPDCSFEEKEAHLVAISRGFWIGQTEVTQAGYERVMKGKNPSLFRGADRPVENVSWSEADAYCRAVGMRLPTEAEWEYAARAGIPSARYGEIDKIAVYAGNSGDNPARVGSKRPNAWGLYDTLGNVLEWTNDWYGEDYYKTSRRDDPPGPSKGSQKVLRGGSWLYWDPGVRVSLRLGWDEERLRDSGALGFRCAGDLR